MIYEVSANGGVSANITTVGVVDWGRAYATVAFPVKENRSVLVGWTYVCQSLLSIIDLSSDSLCL